MPAGSASATAALLSISRAQAGELLVAPGLRSGVVAAGGRAPHDRPAALWIAEQPRGPQVLLARAAPEPQRQRVRHGYRCRPRSGIAASRTVHMHHKIGPHGAGPQMLDALRLAPGDDAATVTARQMRELIERLITAGRWKDADPEILIVVDAGYDVPRLAFLLKDLPVQVLGRMRSDRVLRHAVPPRELAVRGRPPRHGGEFVFGDPATWNTPDIQTVTATRLYGSATARAWDRLHPRLTHRSAWTAELGALPVIEGTVIRLQVEHLPSGATPKPVWLWWSGTAATVDLLWQAFQRRFDIEHTFRLFKQTLGWTCPKIRSPEAADRWTWLILAAFTQLRLARPLAADLRRPWEKQAPPDRLTPARVRRDFRHLRTKAACPAEAPKTARPGPGRPPRRKNNQPTARYGVHTVGRPGSAKRRTKKSTTPRPRRTVKDQARRGIGCGCTRVTRSRSVKDQAPVVQDSCAVVRRPDQPPTSWVPASVGGAGGFAWCDAQREVGIGLRSG
ncbi:transposase [Streptomyces sp. NBC_00344]|uniref:transposase n=1 Tax=Streptomyces sp. NBC_00344 TaxID=2975720 RepID=UPI002E22DAE6